MAIKKRIIILTEAEAQEFYTPPAFGVGDQRFFFSLDDRERNVCKKIRQRRTRCMLVLLLGYFKVKPVVLVPRYHQVKIDLKYIPQNILPGSGFAPFTLNQKEIYRLYSRIFKLVGYQGWSSKMHPQSLLDYLGCQAQAWLDDKATIFL